MLNTLSRNTLSEAVLGKPINRHKPYQTGSKLYLVRFDEYILNLLFL